jgi:hypothetical protein
MRVLVVAQDLGKYPHEIVRDMSVLEFEAYWALLELQKEAREKNA